MWLLKAFLVVRCFVGILARPLDTGLPASDTSLTADEYWDKILISDRFSQPKMDKDETWQSILDSLPQPTAPPTFNNYDRTVRTNIVAPNYYDNSSYEYSSGYSEYSGTIGLIIIIKIILLITCCGCRIAARRQRPAQNLVALRVPNNAQPRSLTVIRRHIFLVVPENNSQNAPTPDDTHDPASHLEQKSLINEDLPPSYEEVVVSNGIPAAPTTDSQ